MTGAELEVWISEHQYDVPGGPSCPVDGAGDPWSGAIYPGAPIEAHAAIAAVDWDAYRKCPTCGRETGRACVSLSGRIVGGQPDGVEHALEHAHVARRRRAGR